MSFEALLKFYIGHGLRQGRARLFAGGKDRSDAGRCVSGPARCVSPQLKGRAPVSFPSRVRSATERIAFPPPLPTSAMPMEIPEEFRRSTNLSGPMLRLVRYAMLAGVLIFGGVAYYLATNRPPEEAPTADLSMLRWVGYGLCAAAIVALGVLRQIREGADEAKRGTLGLIGSALAESAAMFGAVYILLGGDVSIYGVGVLIFLATWTLLPADLEAT